MALNNPLDAGSLRVFASSATSVGANTSTINCTGLPGAGGADFDGNLVVITSGTYKGEARMIDGSTTGSSITVASAFSGLIQSGTKFGIFGIRSPAAVDVAAILADTNELQTDWAGGGRLGLLIDAILADTNAVQLRTRYRHEPHATAITEEIQLTAVAADKALGTIVVAGIPAAATVTEAYLDLEFRAVENTSSAGANNLDGAQNIQLQKASGGWATGIALADNLFNLAASTREGGILLRGTADVSATVTADDTYTIKWTLAKADRDELQFNDVQARMRITFSV